MTTWSDGENGAWFRGESVGAAGEDETLAVKTVETTSEGEQLSLKIAYCNRCGVALGSGVLRTGRRVLAEPAP